MDSIEALSKSSSNIIGITKWCDPESLSHELIEPSLEWQDLGLTSRSDIIISVAALLEEQKSKFLYLLMHEAGKTLEDAADEIREAVVPIQNAHFCNDVHRVDVIVDRDRRSWY